MPSDPDAMGRVIERLRDIAQDLTESAHNLRDDIRTDQPHPNNDIYETVAAEREEDAEHIRRAADILSALPEAGPAEVGWRPIESAPKDGTVILVGHAKATFDAWWVEEAGGWVDGATNLYDEFTTYQPTHWMPLPPPPLDRAGGGEVEGEG